MAHYQIGLDDSLVKEKNSDSILLVHGVSRVKYKLMFRDPNVERQVEELKRQNGQYN